MLKKTNFLKNEINDDIALHLHVDCLSLSYIKPSFQVICM